LLKTDLVQTISKTTLDVLSSTIPHLTSIDSAVSNAESSLLGIDSTLQRLSQEVQPFRAETQQLLNTTTENNKSMLAMLIIMSSQLDRMEDALPTNELSLERVTQKRPMRHPKPQVNSRHSTSCTCRANSTQFIGNPWRRSIFNTVRDIYYVHERHCPAWYTSWGQRTVQVNIGIGPLRRTGLVELNYSPYNWWWQTFGISSNLKFRATVSYNALPFSSLVEVDRDFLHELDNGRYRNLYQMIAAYERRLEMWLNNLENAYRNGKASPYDISQKGENILHVSGLQCN
jgi:hypothetical protein